MSHYTLCLCLLPPNSWQGEWRKLRLNLQKKNIFCSCRVGYPGKQEPQYCHNGLFNYRRLLLTPLSHFVVSTPFLLPRSFKFYDSNIVKHRRVLDYKLNFTFVLINEYHYGTEVFFGSIKLVGQFHRISAHQLCVTNDIKALICILLPTRVVLFKNPFEG